MKAIYCCSTLEEALAIIRENPLNLRHLEAKWKNNFFVVKEAVLRNGCALRYASVRLQNNRVILEFATKKDGFAIQYAGRDFRDDNGDIDDASLALIALEDTGKVFSFLSDRLKKMKEIVIAATRSYCDKLRNCDDVPESLKGDSEVQSALAAARASR